MLIWVIGCILTLNFTLAEANQSPNLEQRMQDLNLPENTAPVTLVEEKLYSVQTRFTPLEKKHELTVGASRGMQSENFIVSYQLNGSYRYHFTDRFSSSFNASYVFNDLSDTGFRLLRNEQIVPDITYTKYLFDLSAAYNLFYAKFRLSMDHVLYFDQYIALGAGVVEMDKGSKPALVGDIGLAFWLGKKVTLRFGLKDYFHAEEYRNASNLVHSFLGHIDLGFLLGEGS